MRERKMENKKDSERERWRERDRSRKMRALWKDRELGKRWRRSRIK